MVDTSGKRWPIIQDILRKEGIAKQHINSFNEFLESGLQSIIKEVSQIEIENAEYPYKVQLGKIKLQKPRMMELVWIFVVDMKTEMRHVMKYQLDRSGKIKRHKRSMHQFVQESSQTNSTMQLQLETGVVESPQLLDRTNYLSTIPTDLAFVQKCRITT